MTGKPPKALEFEFGLNKHLELFENWVDLRKNKNTVLCTMECAHCTSHPAFSLRDMCDDVNLVACLWAYDLPQRTTKSLERDCLTHHSSHCSVLGSILATYPFITSSVKH